MSNQIAKLFLRGSLCNVTIKNLSEEQRRKVEDVVADVMGDPILQKARKAFVQALACTIGNEYKDPEFAMEEVTIAVWRATASALYHKPMPEVIDNPVHRKKFYQEWIFNSLKQILAENKITRIRKNDTFIGLNVDLARDIVSRFLGEHNIPITNVDKKADRHITMTAEISRLPRQMLPKLWKINQQLQKHGVTVSWDDHDPNCLHIKSNGAPEIVSAKIPSSVSVKTISFEAKEPEDGDSIRYALEYEYAEKSSEAEHERKEFSDTLKSIREKLPTEAKAVLDTMMSPPDSYIARYGDEIRQNHIADFLNRSQKDITNVFELIRMHFLSAGMTPDGAIGVSCDSNNSHKYVLGNIAINGGMVSGCVIRDGSSVGKLNQDGSITFIDPDEEIRAIATVRHLGDRTPSWLMEAMPIERGVSSRNRIQNTSGQYEA